MSEIDAITGQTFASVWDAIEDTPADAANMRLRSDLLLAVQQAVTAWGVDRADAAERLAVTRPRLGDLLRGRIGKFSLDALIELAVRAGLEVRVQASPTAVTPTWPRVTRVAKADILGAPSRASD
jgi:predicted XRE-type DNA-binding protein